MKREILEDGAVPKRVWNKIFASNALRTKNAPHPLEPVSPRKKQNRRFMINKKLLK